MALYFKITGYFFGAVLLLGLFGMWAKDYFAVGMNEIPVGEVVSVVDKDTEDESGSSEFVVEEVLSDLYVPWSIKFLSEDRMIVAERNGILQQAFKNNETAEWIKSVNPLYIFEEVSQRSEEGLMGLAIDPDYSENGYIYACVAYEEDGEMNIKVERLKDDKVDSITEKETIISDLPGARFHAGCALGFGPDDKLYITTGDAFDKSKAQELSELNGKLLRINSDGTIPVDNPFENSPIWSLGHRNSQGIDWHPVSGVLASSEHGPSIIDGPAGGDEINIIGKGENFGWPVVSHEKSRPEFVDPALVFTPAIAPASGVFYDGGMFEEYYGDFFVGMLKGEGILRVIFDESGDKIIGTEKLANLDFGRVRAVENGLDGAIYFSTSNTDGRGTLRENDDKIYRMIKR
jgi:glucose/arabinose dehydrogenase